MSNISQWNTTDESNTSSPPAGAPEGIPASSLNDIVRAMMGAVARWYSDTDGTLVTAGSGNAYTLTSNSSFTLHADISYLAFRVDRANTGTATLAVDGLSAKTLRSAGSALISGQLVADSIVTVSYNSTDDVYEIHSVIKIDAADLVGELADARLSSNVPLKDAANEFTADQKISNTSPSLQLEETDGGSDAKIWDVAVNGEILSISVRADDGSAGEALLTVSRSGSAIGTANFANGTIQVSSSRVLTEADEGSGNGLDADTVDGIEGAALRDAQINTQNGNYTLVIGDAGKTIYKASGGAGETVTIPANSSVAFTTGTMVTFVNRGGGDLSIAITTDTLQLAGGSSTGTRTLGDGGMATALKVASTVWMISGSGLS